MLLGLFNVKYICLGCVLPGSEHIVEQVDRALVVESLLLLLTSQGLPLLVGLGLLALPCRFLRKLFLYLLL